MIESLGVATNRTSVVLDLAQNRDGVRILPDKDLQVQYYSPLDLQLFTPRLGIVVPEIRQSGVEEFPVDEAEVKVPEHRG